MSRINSKCANSLRYTKKSEFETIIGKIIAKICKSEKLSKTEANHPIRKEIQRNPDSQRLQPKFCEIHEYLQNSLILRNVCVSVEKFKKMRFCNNFWRNFCNISYIRKMI